MEETISALLVSAEAGNRTAAEKLFAVHVAENHPDGPTLSRIGDAIDGLATIDPMLAQLVDLKFFCGFSFGEIAAMRGVSERTVQRDWEKARIYLHRTLRSDLLS